MNSDIKAEWVRRLRSGVYEQATGRLHRARTGALPEAFCCLGVLCTIAVDAGVIPPPAQGTEIRNSMIYGKEGDTSTTDLPYMVSRWADCAEQPWVNLPDAGLAISERVPPVVTLAEVNDTLQWDFDKIADLIEAQL